MRSYALDLGGKALDPGPASEEPSLDDAMELAVSGVDSITDARQPALGIFELGNEPAQAFSGEPAQIADLGLKAPISLVHLRCQLDSIRRQSHRCLGRRRAPEVGDKLRDGRVGFVPDRCDGGNRHVQNRIRHRSFVEAPQVLEASPPAGDDDRVDVEPMVMSCDGLQRCDDVVYGSRALYQRIYDDDSDGRAAPPHRCQHILQRRSGS